VRIIARSTLAAFWREHPETERSLRRWLDVAKGARWASMAEVQRAWPKAKVLNAERVRFEIAGGNYRMIVAFRFQQQIAFIKFLGTHNEYDSVNALEISLF
jgi:mRNA interferase HigB